MIIGLTGSFGSGKTSIAKMFKGLGAYVIDADAICHSLMRLDKGVRNKVLRNFGTIDRAMLGKIVFKDRAMQRLLNRLLHPGAIRKMDKIAKTKKKKAVIVDAPLLIESGYYKKMDKVIIVKNNKDKQIRRIVRAKGMARKEIMQRIRMQMPLKKKLAFADFIIDNGGSMKNTLIQVKVIWSKIGGRS
ncbi:MAG: dephospho-CoA kinase [Candidatus Omnitrophica bacterium]|nr:dephospho-CoA kinase [Candidatus Omnitrophota bacterium]